MSERADTLKLCQDVTSALCANLSRKDREIIKEFFTQLSGPPGSLSIERTGSTTDNDEISAIIYEVKFGLVVPVNPPCPSI